MKRVVKASSDLKEYEVVVNFCGFVGSEETYYVHASDDDEAEDLAIEEASDDLSVVDVTETDEGEWTVTVGFNSMIGVESDYEVYEDDEEAACDAALEEAKSDLSVEEISTIS